MTWYNEEHRHSGLGLLSPAVVHYGLALAAIQQHGAPFWMPPTLRILRGSFVSRRNHFERQQRVCRSTSHNKLQRIKLSKLYFLVSQTC